MWMVWKCRVFFGLLFLLFCNRLYAQNCVITILDAESGEGLSSTVIQTDNGKSSITDSQGKASLSIFPESVIIVRRLGYHPLRDTLHTIPDTKVYHLKIATQMIQEVEITAKKAIDQISDHGVQHITQKELRQAPTLGEADVMSAIKVQAGVSSGGESVSGFYVRGGAMDQNLILLDNATVFNPSHLFGFFSVFNAQAVGDLTFRKSGFLPQDGGRISSITKVSVVEPDLSQFKAKVAITTIAASASTEVPIVKDKLSVFMSGRRMYIDQLSGLVFGEGSDINNSLNSYFLDLNGKVFFRPSKRDKFSYTFFKGVDGYRYDVSDQNRGFRNFIDWENEVHVFNWSHSYGLNTFQETSLSYSKYKSLYDASLLTYDIGIRSAINEWKGVSSIYWEVGDHELAFSLDAKGYRFTPNTYELTSADVDFTTRPAEYLKATEFAYGLNDQYQIGDDWLLSFGLRHSFYIQLGEFSRFSTGDGRLPSDTTTYDRGQKVVGYNTLEPRVSLSRKVSEHSSIRLSYDVNSQYVHLAPISSVSLPTDTWVPSSERLKPQLGRMLSLDYQFENEESGLLVELGGYFKRVENVVEYQNGILLGYGNSPLNYDDNFLSGRLESKGVETHLSKDFSKLNLSLRYTLSKTDQIFEELNEGRSFPAKYDSRHNINGSISYQLGKRVTFNALFTYSSGYALTVPNGRYYIDGNVVGDYTRRNNLRLPAYHRADVGVEFKGKKDGVWKLSVYNVYNYRNPYYVYFDIDGNVDELRLSIDLEQVSLFTIVPSIGFEKHF